MLEFVLSVHLHLVYPLWSCLDVMLKVLVLLLGLVKLLRKLHDYLLVCLLHFP